MSTALLFVVLGAGLARPGHMLWRHFRGHGASCLPRTSEVDHVEQVRRRQQALGDELARMRSGRDATAVHDR